MSIRNRSKSLLSTTLWVLVLASLSGCAYFNTFYHAKQFYGQAERARASERGQSGAASASSGFYKQAIQKCERIIEKYPGSKWADDAYLLMAESHYWRGDYLSAQEALTSLLDFKKSGLRDQALYWQGRTALAEENYSAAQSTWQALLKEYPKYKNREEVEYYMARASWLGGDPNAAIGQYQALLKRYPNGEHAASARLDVGDLLVEQKRYDEAGKIFAYVTQKGKLEDDRIQAKISLGDVLEKQERYQDALKLYTDLEVSLDASARKNRMTWQARQALEAEEQRRRQQEMQDSIRNASLQQQLGSNDPNDPNQLDPNAIDPNTGLPLAQNQNQPPTNIPLTRKPSTTLQRDSNDPRQKDLAQVLIREGCVLANLDRSDDAITAFQQVVVEYPSTPFAAEAQYRIGYTYEVHKEAFDRAQLAYDAVSRQGNSAFRDEALRRSKNLVTLRTLMASAAKDSASTATSAAAETRFMRAELYLFQQENTGKAIDEYASIEKEFKGTEHAAKAGLALAWIMEHSEGDSAKAMAKYTEVAEQYPNTEYGRRAHEVVFGPEPEPQPGDFQGPSLAELTTPENQEAARLQVMGDSAATAQPNVAAAGGVTLPGSPGGIAPGVVAGGLGVAALGRGSGTMAPDETGPPLVADLPADSTLIAGPGPADPNAVAGLDNPTSQLPAGTDLTHPNPVEAQPGGPNVTSASAGGTGAGVNPTAAAATPTGAGALGSAGSATGPVTGVGPAGASLGSMVKATREHAVSPPDSTHHDSTGTSSNSVSANPQVNPQTALPGGLYLDPLAVPVDGPSPVTPPDTTGVKKAAPAAVPPKPATQKPAEHKSSEKAATSSGKGSKSSSSSGKNSSGKTAKPSSSGKNDKKGAAPDSTSGKGSP